MAVETSNRMQLLLSYVSDLVRSHCSSLEPGLPWPNISISPSNHVAFVCPFGFRFTLCRGSRLLKTLNNSEYWYDAGQSRGGPLTKVR